MMLSAIYAMLSSVELFNPNMYEESLRASSDIVSPEQQLARFAKRLGCSVVKVPDSVYVWIRLFF